MPSTIADLTELTAIAADDYFLIRDTSDLTNRDKKISTANVQLALAKKTGTPTAGQVASWADANTVQSAGFLASDVPQINVTKIWTSAQRFHGGITFDYGVANFANFSQGINAIYVPNVSVTAANTVICSLSSLSGTVTEYGGLFYIWVRSQAGTSSNSAAYLYVLSKMPSGTAAFATSLSSHGLINGSVAGWPSFTFSVDATNNKLLASPINITSMAAWFTIICMGHVMVSP